MAHTVTFCRPKAALKVEPTIQMSVTCRDSGVVKYSYYTIYEPPGSKATRMCQHCMAEIVAVVREGVFNV